MTDILLINPPCDTWITRTEQAQPLGLCYIASSLRNEGYEVKILDAVVERMTTDETIDYIKKLSPLSVGFYTTSGQIKKCLEISKILKELGIKTVFGGPFITNLPGVFSRYDCFDHAFIGEAEITFPNFFKKMLKNNGRTIEYGKDADINDSPMPAYDLIPMHKYRTPFKGGKFCIILTSRGCPFNCIYCSHSRNVRFRAAENIVEEIRFLHDKYDVKWIHFWDDIFTVNKKHTIEICKTLLKEKIDVTFQCQTRVETLDEELLTIMHKAGCRVMGLGIESAHQKTRKFIGKGIISWNIIEKNIKLTKKIGIEPMVNMMIGLPGETAKDINNSINKLASLEPGFLFPHITVAYPNTILFDMGLKKGIFHSDVWYDFVDGNTPLPHYVEPPMTMGKLKRFQSIALRRFFLRPNYILRKTSKIRSFQDVMSNLMGAFNLPFRQK